MTQESYAEAPPEEHAHRWRIEEPSGSESVGVCSSCGATRSFKNWLAETDFITNEERRQAAA
jgi:hypothetical protein